jgi:hypothetical protein
MGAALRRAESLVCEQNLLRRRGVPGVERASYVAEVARFEYDGSSAEFRVRLRVAFHYPVRTG